jgi:tetratricopeptide (TPR) repeat protein
MPNCKSKEAANFDMNNFTPNKIISSTLAGLIFICILAITLYANTLWNGFVFDDEAVLTKHQSVTKGLDGIGEIFTHGSWWGYEPDNDLHVYRPLQLTALALQYELFGLSAAKFHLVHVLCYAFLCGTLLILLRKIFQQLPHGGNLALLTTILFTAHPIHTEVVANIKGNGDLLALLFGLLALHQIWDYNQKCGAWRFAASGLLFLAALLCKETIVTLIGVAGLMLFIFTPQKIWKIALSLVPMAVAIIIYLVARSLVFGDNANKLETNGINNAVFLADGLSQQIGLRMYALGKNLQLLLMPYPLLMMYVHASIPMVEAYEIASLFPAIVYTAITLLFFFNLKRGNMIGFVCGSYLITIFLFSNLLFSIPNIVSERWLFLPSLSICLGLALSFLWLFKYTPKVTYAALGLLLFGYCGYTIQRNFDWKSNLSLVERDIHTSPNSVLINSIYANSLLVKATGSKPIEYSTLREAVYYYEQSVRLNPSDANKHNLLGIAYEQLQEHEKAAAAFKIAMSLKSKIQGKAKFSHAKNLNLAGKYSEALEAWKLIDESYPDVYEVKQGLVLALDALGQTKNALNVLKAEIPKRTNDQSLYERSAKLTRKLALEQNHNANLLRDSLKYYKKALEYGADRSITFNNIGIVYSDLDMDREAANAFLEATKQESPIQGKAYFSYAKHLGLSGQVEEAFRAWQSVDEKYPNVIEVQYEIAQILRTRGEISQAQKYFSRLIELISSNPDPAKYSTILENIKPYLNGNDDA